MVEDYFKKRLEEFKRLIEKAKSNPNYTEEMIKTFETMTTLDLKQGEEQSLKDDKIIKNTKEILSKIDRAIFDYKFDEKCAADHHNLLKKYREKAKTSKTKTCWFQENVVCEILEISGLFNLRINGFARTCLDMFYKDSYAALVLARTNIENLFLFYYYIRQVEELIKKKRWLAIAILNARIKFAKFDFSLTRYELSDQMDYMEIVSILITMNQPEDKKQDKPLHINTALDFFWEDLEKKYVWKFNNLVDHSILDQFLKSNQIPLIDKIQYSKEEYNRLCEIVHPTAIRRKSYPFDHNDPNVKFKFARAYVNTPFATNLYFYGITLYEQLKKINKDEMEKIEQELHSSISKAAETYTKQTLDLIKKTLKN